MSTSSLARIWGLALARIGRPATRGRLLLPPAPRRASSGRPTAALSPPSYFRILALESSADDTGAACVDSNRRILSNVVLKQHEIHALHGGIQPKEAQHAHIQAMPTAIRRALAEANLRLADIDGIAFTQGPGMFGCLSVAASAAGALAAATGKPLIGVNHMQGHALTPLMTEARPPDFPFLTLLISGGHSQLLLATAFDSYEILVDTGTLPLGTCFDRLGKSLGLEYGFGLGPALEQTAALNPAGGESSLPPLQPVKFPSTTSRTFDFDGILASLQHELVRLAPASAATLSESKARHDATKLSQNDRIAVARAFQDAVTRILVKKVRVALNAQRASAAPAIGSFVVSGGVACNAYIRSRLVALGQETGLRVLFPPLALCTDNAAMIGNAAIHRLRYSLRLNALDDILPRRKWSLEDVKDPAPSI